MQHLIEYVDVVLLALICVQFSLHRKRNEATLSSILKEMQELRWQLRKYEDPPLYPTSEMPSDEYLPIQEIHRNMTAILSERDK